MANRLSFSQRHPLLFGLMLIIAAMVLIVGAMAAFSSWRGGSSGLVSLGGGKLGIVHVSGPISDSRAVTEWLRTLREDDSVKGVLLRVNSPGGVVAPSQEIHQAVKRCAEVKPVVASFAAVAASGGYYVASGADHIVSNPGTLTGSIGAVLSLTNIKDLMDKLGIGQQAIASGKFKAAGNPFTELTPEEEAYFQALIDDIHGQFVSDVAEGRGLALERVQELADGRAYTGRQAFDLGLVDQLGGLEEALENLKERCQVSGRAELVEGPKEERSLLGMILGHSRLEKTLDQQGPRWELRYE